MGNYLLAGAAGFIGSWVTEMLLDAGHNVFGVDNMNDTYDIRMKNHRLDQLLNYPNFAFTKLDIADRSIVDPDKFHLNLQTTNISTLPSIDAIINLAARAGVRQSIRDPWGYIDTNMTGTLNLLELCRLLDIPKFILASTSSIYGHNAPLPTPEDADSDHPLQSYAASKKGAESLCYAYHHLYNLDITIFRYFTVYGPAGRPDMSMFRFVQWIYEGYPLHLYGDGTQSRGYTYVEDIARGTIAGLKPLGYEIINLGGHEQIVINDLIHMIEDMIGKKAHIEYHPMHPADMHTNWANVEKAGRLLGWEPHVDIVTGLKKLINWYNAERSWARYINTD